MQIVTFIQQGTGLPTTCKLALQHLPTGDTRKDANTVHPIPSSLDG